MSEQVLGSLHSSVIEKSSCRLSETFGVLDYQARLRPVCIVAVSARFRFSGCRSAAMLKGLWPVGSCCALDSE